MRPAPVCEPILPNIHRLQKHSLPAADKRAVNQLVDVPFLVSDQACLGALWPSELTHAPVAVILLLALLLGARRETQC